MKKILLLVICSFLVGIKAKAQFEITPFGGYVFDASFGVENGKAKIGASPELGIHLSIPLKYYDGQIEFTYERQDTKIRTSGTDLSGMSIADTIPVSINYFLIGGNYEEYRKPHHIVPFGGIQMGLGVIDGKDEYGNAVPFAFAFKGGLKYFFNDYIGIRVQGNLNIMVLFEGSNVACAVGTSGSGCGFVITTTSSTGQFALSGGLVFKLPGGKKKETKPQNDIF